MKDYAHSRGQFADWKGEEAKRSWLMQCLTLIVRVRALASFGSILPLDDYRKVNQEFMLEEEFGGPYPLCASCSASGVFEWANITSRDKDKIRFVFEGGAKNSGALLERMKRENILPTFGKKTEFPALQAADLLAWEHLKTYRQFRQGTLTQFRKSMAALMGGLPNYSGIFDADSLQRYCKAMSVPSRSSFPTPDP